MPLDRLRGNTNRLNGHEENYKHEKYAENAISVHRSYLFPFVHAPGGSEDIAGGEKAHCAFGLCCATAPV
jgi:hypothetical protein